MCNRYVSPDAAAIERAWHIGARNVPNPWRGGGVYPRALGPFVRRVLRDADAPGERELVVGQWGLVPWFARSARLAYSTNNARRKSSRARRPSSSRGRAVSAASSRRSRSTSRAGRRGALLKLADAQVFEAAPAGAAVQPSLIG